MLLRLPLLLAAVLLSGCGARFMDTKTVHNPDATRLWIVQDQGGDQHVVLCDVAMLQTTHVLCTRWPAP